MAKLVTCVTMLMLLSACSDKQPRMMSGIVLPFCFMFCEVAMESVSSEGGHATGGGIDQDDGATK